ncbi:unnamed protein product [Pleuronectes platessa]|uniref:Uncharacterized protein n=1 Tax=Pleuronectes platessa TaxID=8262 RepID=A0A9N7U9F2_PLEPL|nr:unnamed protein product [Pleuronectes platessa]
MSSVGSGAKVLKIHEQQQTRLSCLKQREWIHPTWTVTSRRTIRWFIPLPGDEDESENTDVTSLALGYGPT